MSSISISVQTIQEKKDRSDSKPIRFYSSVVQYRTYLDL